MMYALAYFKNGSLAALRTPGDTMPAPEADHVYPVALDSELYTGLTNERARYRDNGGTLERQDQYSPVDMTPHVAAKLESDRVSAVAALDAAWSAKMTAPYIVDESTSVPLYAATKLADLMALAGPMVQAGRGAQPVGADIPGGRVVLTWDDVLKHAGPFTLAVGDVQSWYQAKLAEIQASDDPASVTL